MSRMTETGRPIISSGETDPKDHILAIGQQRVHVNAITSKVLDDINFLRDRIEKIKQLKSPNTTILNTYQEMLCSRESVLAWLQKHEMTTNTESTKKQVS